MTMDPCFSRWLLQTVHRICWPPSALCMCRNSVRRSTSTSAFFLCPSFQLHHVRSHQTCRIYPKSFSYSDWCVFSTIHHSIPCAMPYSLYRQRDSSAAFSVQQHPQRMSLHSERQRNPINFSFSMRSLVLRTRFTIFTWMQTNTKLQLLVWSVTNSEFVHVV